MKVKGYKSPNDFEPRVHIPCKRKLKINSDAYHEFISKKCPYGIKPFLWSKMRAKERLEYHLRVLAYPNSFSYEMVD